MMTGPVRHPAWCDPSRCGATPDRPGGTHCSRLITVGPYPPSPVFAEVSLTQSLMVPGYPASGLPLVILGVGEPPDEGDELPMTPLPVDLAGAIGRVLLDIVREVRQ
jgi:hypothetical protein